jgi:hypothetical protein
MDRLILHCGLHKTGSTAVQATMHRNRDRLAESGIHYATTGVEGCGHHNLAWELMRDRRFDAVRGSFEDLESEIKGVTGHVLISSEDFESILHLPDRLLALERLAQRCGRALQIVVFLRNQIDYFESLYLEQLRHGCGQEASRLAEEALRTGWLSIDEWVYQFDYARMLETLFGTLEHSAVSVGVYDANSRADITRAFLQISFPEVDRPFDLRTPERFNTRLPLTDSLRSFLRNRLDGALSSSALRSATKAMERAQFERVALGAELRKRFTDRFEAGNSQVCRRLERVESALSGSKAVSDGTAVLEGVFSFETAALVNQAATRSVSRAQLFESLTQAWSAGR